MSLAKRIDQFYSNSSWLSHVMGGMHRSAPYLVVSKFYPSLEGKARYRNLPVRFRKHDMSALREVFIDEEYIFLKPILSRLTAPRILDVGAHIGTFALWCFSQTPHAEIFSLEADPDTFLMLEKNQQLKPSQLGSWRILNRAAWRDCQELSFMNEGDSMSHKVSGKGNIRVQGIDFQDLVQETGFDQIDLMKLDIEGSEEEFLRGQSTLLHHVKNLVIEIHPNLCSEKAILHILKSHYDDIENIEGRRSSKPLLLCRR